MAVAVAVAALLGHLWGSLILLQRGEVEEEVMVMALRSE
jgi:hypothetical protein